MAVSVDQFGKALVASGLMTADEVKAFWSETSADARPKDGEAFARLLVERGTLTAFQAKQISAGRGGVLVLGEYVVLDEIGAGGMGQVYKAQHRRMKRVVALKVMSRAAMKDEASVKRFQREVEAAARLEHPNIVTAYDAGRTGNVAFLVMQFAGSGDPAVNGLEVQLLDDPAYPTVGPDQRCGALYKLAAAQAGRYTPWPEWNHLVVQTLGRDLAVTLNGDKVLHTTRPTLQKVHPEHTGAQRTSGKICLFPHTARSEYRNFRVREATWTVAAPK